ncbi:HMG box-containing protein 1-like [Myripristis murdjan]|uniref:HMG box-containing protein 1-like n=1 Tax=Myripristis murdjan TaxID=586833 RepID=UPI00117620CF|nr:HMG box-containing protein 1-like [Myripristis murdjan]XP_029901764.1 HMG box-containing protein 1-like [Myripristis murdjan]
MVWEVPTPAKHRDPPEPEPQCEHSDAMTDADGGRSCDQLHCEERLPASPGDSHMEYDDLPELQEVQEEAAPVYQVEVGVSHQERTAHVHEHEHTHSHARSHHPAPPDTLWLTQLAHIATGPQSPLLQGPAHCSSSPLHVFGSSSNLHSYARPPPPPPAPLCSAPSPPTGHSRERRRSRTSSECGSAVSTRSSLSDDEDMGWSFTWPPTAWHCFLKGTRLRFHGGSNLEWQDAEEVDSGEEDSGDEEDGGSLKAYGSEGLRLLRHAEVVSSGQSVLQLTFDPGAFGHAPLTAQCQLDHPFYVRNKGWASFYPSLTVVHYGIPCYEVEVGDVCLPPGHRDAAHTDDSLVFDAFRSYDFTPLDSSAVYVLSSMARRRRTSQSSGGAVSPDRDTLQDTHSPGPSHSPAGKPIRSQHATAAGSSSAAPPTKCKRPMNAFMLFAKKFRVEYTQMYPGKDNRAISVLLGERWKKMRGEERRAFTLQAKALADEQKRLNPDCWKRKRTSSGCQGT